MSNSLETRMKLYEHTFRQFILPRTPCIIRLDGKAFHTFTRSFEKPFDMKLADAMNKTAEKLLNEIQNARFAYVQSDEISILLIDYNKFNSQQWFSGNIQKIVSISASMAGVTFSKLIGKTAYFDSRIISLPENEVVNYFIWRQQDAVRNSIQMVAQSLYSQKELYKKDCNQLQEMIFQKGINWSKYDSILKNGRILDKTGLYKETPIFQNDRSFLEQWLKIEET